MTKVPTLHPAFRVRCSRKSSLSAARRHPMLTPVPMVTFLHQKCRDLEAQALRLTCQARALIASSQVTRAEIARCRRLSPERRIMCLHGASDGDDGLLLPIER